MSAKETAAYEHAGGDANDNRGRCNSDTATKYRYRNPQAKPDSSRYSDCDPQLISGHASHDDRLPVQSVREEGNCRSALRFTALHHGRHFSEDASRISQQPNGKDEQNRADRNGQSKLTPGFSSGMDFGVRVICVIADPNKHDYHHKQRYEQ